MHGPGEGERPQITQIAQTTWFQSTGRARANGLGAGDSGPEDCFNPCPRAKGDGAWPASGRCYDEPPKSAARKDRQAWFVLACRSLGC